MDKIDSLPSITVIIPAYELDKLDLLTECIDSILEQEYSAEFDIVVITEGDELTNRVENKYNLNSTVRVVCIENPDGGVSVARNAGIDYADGEVIAYIDSDATADSNWLQTLGEMYRDKDVVAVGGRAIPNWVGDRPWYLPNEFLWLVGATHAGHPSDGTIVRSTFGCNISYRAAIFEEIDGFKTKLGKSHGFNLQGEEPELGARIQSQFETGVYYTEDAIVSHAVEPYQCTFSWLSKRAYLQGVTKAIMEEVTPESELDTEQDFLAHLLLTSLPYCLGRLVTGPSRKTAGGHLVGLLLFTALVFFGYARGKLPK